LIALFLLLLAAPQAAEFKPSARQLSWELSRWPDESEAVERFQTEYALDEELPLLAAARAWADSDRLDLLLEQFELKPEVANSSLAGIRAVLRAAPMHTEAAIQAAHALAKHAELREEAQLALLRAQRIPAEPSLHPDSLELALNRGWVPTASTLGTLLRDPATRARLWPVLVGLRLPAASVAVIEQLDQSSWPAGDRLLAQVVLADASFPHSDATLSATRARELWRGWMTVQLPTAQANRALQDALARHLIDCPAAALREEWLAATPTQQQLGIELLAELAYPVGAELLREAVFTEELSVELRTRCAQALFRCGSQADLEALAELLQPDTPAQLLRNLLGGFRVRRPVQLAARIEALLPKLRTRSANLAIELLVLEGDDEQRLRWLNAMRTALPQRDQLRILQAAIATGPTPALEAWCRAQAAQTDEHSQLLGRIGLSELISDAELSGLYLELLRQAPDAEARQTILRSARELRSDASLQVLVDWLASQEGREHPTSADWAGLLIEEAAAEALFRDWWRRREQLTPVQADWAAAHLAPQLADARAHLHQRFPVVSLRTQAMFLSRLEDGASETEFLLWRQILLADGVNPALRRSAAFLLARQMPASAPYVEACWDHLDGQLAAQSEVERAHWPTLARAAAASLDAQQREQLRARFANWAPDFAQEMQRAVWQAEADVPQPESLELLEDQLFELLCASSTPLSDHPAPNFDRVLARHQQLELRLIPVRAHTPDPDLDRRWADKLEQLGTQLHPDAIALLHKYCESNWPELTRAAAAWLTIVESPDSWRLPPSVRPAEFGLPLSAEWRPTPFFEQVEAAYANGELAVAQAALRRVLERWPGDRRSHLWLGWTALEAREFAAARTAFSQAQAWSGWLPYALLEPSLGLAVTDFLQSNDAQALLGLIDDFEQSRDILRGRTFADRMPALWSELELASG